MRTGTRRLLRSAFPWPATGTGTEVSVSPRHTERWEALMATRQAVERCFSRLKGHRTLDVHCRRGLRKVRLHVLMAVLALQAGAVAKAKIGELGGVRVCTRKVA